MAILIAVAGLASAASAQQFDPFHEARIDDRRGASIPLDTRFVDETGHSRTLRTIAGGKPLLLVPVLHRCPNFCSVTLAGVTAAIDALPPPGAKNFVTLAFGIDPQEGPDAARSDLSRLREQTGRAPPPNTHALTGAQPDIRRVTDALGYHYAWDDRIGQYAHAAGLALITPDGHLSRWFYGLRPDPAELAKALDQAQANRTGSWTEQLLLVCFLYDPQTGRYTATITDILRLAGLLTIAAIGLTILALRRKTA